MNTLLKKGKINVIGYKIDKPNLTSHYREVTLDCRRGREVTSTQAPDQSQQWQVLNPDGTKVPLAEKDIHIIKFRY